MYIQVSLEKYLNSKTVTWQSVNNTDEQFLMINVYISVIGKYWTVQLSYWLPMNRGDKQPLVINICICICIQVKKKYLVGVTVVTFCYRIILY
jgi:hypothetical protein